MDFTIEGIDFDEAADTILGEDVRQTYQSNFDNLLNGLKSPIQQEQDLQIGDYGFNGSQDHVAWSMDDIAMGGSFEATTEPFPDLPQSNIGPVESTSHLSNATNAIPIPASNDRFRDLTSSFPPSSHYPPPSDQLGLPSTLIPNQSVGLNRGLEVSTGLQVIEQGQQSVLPIRTKSNRSKPGCSSRRSRGSSLNEGKKSIPLTRVGSGLKKGVRAGQLPPAKAMDIKQKRVNKTVCIFCKSKRVTVSD